MKITLIFLIVYQIHIGLRNLKELDINNLNYSHLPEENCKFNKTVVELQLKTP